MSPFPWPPRFPGLFEPKNLGLPGSNLSLSVGRYLYSAWFEEAIGIVPSWAEESQRFLRDNRT